jgi:Concanavalin A-like lectin/glucanases superfamily/Calx-beta domain
MKTFTTTPFHAAFGAHIRAMLLLFLLPLSISAVFAQVTATETFEGELNFSDPGYVGTFSQGGITFTRTLPMWVRYSSGSNIGANSSGGWFESPFNVDYSNQNVGGFTIQAGKSFKINSFAAWTSNVVNATSFASGVVTFTGTKPDNTTVTATRTITPLNNTGTGWQLGINFTGTALDNVQLIKLEFTLPANLKYFSIDDINFTAQDIVTNQYSINDVSQNEGLSGSSNFGFTISRTQTGATGSVTVNTANGTATAGSDYTAITNQVVNFNIGEATKTVNVVVSGDATVEPNETFFVNLSSPVGGTFSDSQGLGTIQDDDEVTETFEDDVDNTAVFSQNSINFISTGRLKVRASSPFGSGGSAKFLTTPVGGPFVSGDAGSIQINTLGKTFNIIGIDLWISDSNINDGGNNGTVTITGTKADGSGTISTSAALTITGTNYQTVNFSATPFNNVQLTSVSFSLPSGITHLQLDNFKYAIVNLAGTQLSISDASVIEGTGAGSNSTTFTVTRSNNTSTFAVNVASSNGTATAGSDYTTTSTTLNFTNGGALTQTVTVPILKDAITEVNETFNMTLSGATNGALILDPVGIGTILDDDGITETFEGETNGSKSFSESGASFTATGDWVVRNSTGSNNSNFRFDTGLGNGASSGNVGTIAITTANKAFRLIGFDGWTSNNDGINFATGTVTVKGNKFGGGSVQTNKTITPTSDASSGWQQNIGFTGTTIAGELFTSIEMIIVSGINYITIDNFKFELVDLSPVIEVVDASNVAITNGSAASTTNNTDFGSTTCSTGGTITKVFTIKNSGYANLTFSGAPLAVLGGTNAAQFSVTTQPTTPIAGAGSTTVTVRYSPNAVGTHNATLTLTNNDATNSPYVINIKGASTSTAGTPSVFGTNTWNVYAWNAGGGTIASAGNWTTNYSGFYTNSNLNFNTTVSWANSASPSSAVATANTTAYQGCTVGVDNHSWSAKRQGFPCSMYQLDIPTHDDAVQLWVNGVKVFEHDGCCDAHTNVWTGFLGTTDRVEFRVTEAVGGSEGQLTFTALSVSPTTTNNALAFDGTNDFVAASNCSGTPIINGGSAITVEYWFKGTVIQSAVRSQDASNYMVAGWSSPAKHILSTDGGTSGGVSVGAAATDNTWHHIAFTWQQGTTNGFKSYLDGVLVQQRDAANVALPVINAELYLGAYFNGTTTSEFMTGAMDEVRIWNVARTQAEIQLGRNPCTFTLPQTGLVVYYQFNHGVGGGANSNIISLVNSANTATYTGVLRNFALSGANSNWTAVSCAVLPVELTSINVTAQPTANLLTWVTASEVNTKGFKIERAPQPSKGASLTWELIGFVNAKGKAATYDFLDLAPPLGAGGAYYRVRSIDNDGTASVSKIVSITRKATGSLKVYPSIATNYLNVETDLTDNFSIINALGQVQMTGKITNYVDINALSKGVYVFKVGEAQAKFVKQ